MTNSGEATGSRQQIGKQTSLLSLVIGRFFKSQKLSSGAQGAEPRIDQSQDQSKGQGSDSHLDRSRIQTADLQARAIEDQAVPGGVAHSPANDLYSVEESPNQTLNSAEAETSAETNSSEWNFSRRSGRSQRSAREWQRGSALNLSDWDNIRRSHSQQSDAVSPDTLLDNADSKECNGCEPVRGKTGEKSRSRTPQRRYLTRGKVNNEKETEVRLESGEANEGHKHKRKSLEAGLSDPAWDSADKVGRVSGERSAAVSDFYPVELQQRSLLFNSRYAPSP